MIEIHKQKMTNELIQKINSWSPFSEKIYGYSKESAKTFLKRLQVGIYNSILKNSYWFSNLPTLDTLIQIETEKHNIHSLTNISEENYIVYSTIHEIKQHIDLLYHWYKAYKIPYYTKENHFEQTNISYEESNKFMNLYDKVLNTNYNWHEARHIVENIKKLNIKENKDFPHNIKEIENLLNSLTQDNLESFISKKRKNKYEEYIRVIFHNTKIQNISEVQELLKSLLTEKKIIELNEELITQPYLTNLRKHYCFIFNHTPEIEFLEESSDILNNLYNIYKDNEDYLYKITLIYNKILISYGIIPIPITTKLLETTNNKKQVIDKTINLAEYLNKG